MAERRMFAKKIVSTDAFLDMPASARCLYFALGMEADDDGFVGNPKSVMRQVGLKPSDLKLLADKRYILTFPSGVIVIKHWRLHNLIRGDRYEPTTYIEEMSTLTLDGKEGYVEKEVEKEGENTTETKCQPNDNQMTTKCQPNDNQMTTKCQHRLGKVSIGKDSIGKYSRLVKILNNKESIVGVRENSKNMPQYEPLVDEIINALAYAGSEIESLKFGDREVTQEEFERFITKPNGFDGNTLVETANMVKASSVAIKDRRYYILGIIVNHFMR